MTPAATPDPSGPPLAGAPVASRRALIVGVGAVAVAALGGCATYSSQSSSGPVSPAPTSPDDGGDDNVTQPPLQTTDIPVGGGKVLDTRSVVVTQPKAGEFKAFTAVCTHQGCTVADVKDGTINCPCHGSQFSISDGSVVTGPARRALRPVTISVNGNTISLG